MPNSGNFSYICYVMIKMNDSKMVRFLLLLCIFMQCVVSMPHHHHKDVEGACINITHVVGRHLDSCAEGGCKSHAQRHDHNATSPITACTSKHFVTIQPEKSQTKIVVAEKLTPSAEFAKPICVAQENVVVGSRFFNEPKENWQPPKESNWTTYSSRALAQRAPSFRFV